MSPYLPRPDRNERFASAIKAAEALVNLDLYPQHKRELLNICVWKTTEVDGKFNIRFCTQGALEAGPETKLNHEHVIERKKLVDRMLAGEPAPSPALSPLTNIDSSPTSRAPTPNWKDGSVTKPPGLFSHQMAIRLGVASARPYGDGSGLWRWRGRRFGLRGGFRSAPGRQGDGRLGGLAPCSRATAFRG